MTNIYISILHVKVTYNGYFYKYKYHINIEYDIITKLYNNI